MKKNHSPWYQPMEDKFCIEKSVHWLLLSHKDFFLNSVGDVSLLPIVLESAKNMAAKPSDKEMADISKKIGLESIFEFSGAPVRIRTPDLLIRSQTLYPAELRARI